MAVLIPAEAAAARRVVEQALEQLESGRGAEVLARMAQAWSRGALDELADYERWCDCVHDEDDRQAYRRLVDERNPGLADRIAELHRSGARLLAAVGALHMTGPQGLPRLLRERGFEVEAVPLAPR
jgi:uncharacterized protein YbaP (TraB family)